MIVIVAKKTTQQPEDQNENSSDDDAETVSVPRKRRDLHPQGLSKLKRLHRKSYSITSELLLVYDYDYEYD